MESRDAGEGLVRVITPEGYLNPWIPLIILPVLVGAIASYLLPRQTAIMTGAAVPFLGLLAVLLWLEFVQPPASGGASMWPIALVIGGTVVAFVGGFSAWCVSGGASHDSGYSDKGLSLAERTARAAGYKGQNTRAMQIIAGLVIAIAAMGIARELFRALPTKGQETAATAPPNATEDKEWTERLRQIVVGAGEQCASVATTFHQGTSPTGGNYWNVRCTGGGSYSILLDGSAAPKVVSCELKEIVCFTK